MSEHNIETYGKSNNFFEVYNIRWDNLEKKDIKEKVNKMILNNNDIFNYIQDIDSRCFYEKNKRDELYKEIIKLNIDNEFVKINKQLCKLDLHILKIDKENMISYLLILSNILKEKKQLRDLINKDKKL